MDARGAARLTGMGLTFPNASRSYNAAKQCVRFGGFDSVFPIAIEVDAGALRKLSPDARQDEASLLAAFDLFREEIEETAGALYNRRKSSFLQLFAWNF
jgi:uncharacterized protein DUF1488